MATIYSVEHAVQGRAGGPARRFQADPAALSRIYVTGDTGAQVPLSTVARFTNKVAPLTVSHQGQFPAVTLSFNLAPGAALGEAVEHDQADAGRSCMTPITLDGSFQGRPRPSSRRSPRRRC